MWGAKNHQWGCRSSTTSSPSLRSLRGNGTGRSVSLARRARRQPLRGVLVPAQLLEAVVVDAEVVRDLVDHGDADLADDVLLVLGHGAQGPAVQGHAVGHDQV